MTIELRPTQVVYIGTDNSELLCAAEDNCYASGNSSYILNIEEVISNLESKQEDEKLSLAEDSLLQVLHTAALAAFVGADAIFYVIFS